MRAVDDHALSGLGAPAQRALAFEAPPETEIQWTVERDHRTIVIVAPAVLD